MLDPYLSFVNTQSDQMYSNIKNLQILFKSSKLQRVDFSNRLKLYFIKDFKYMRILN